MSKDINKKIEVNEKALHYLLHGIGVKFPACPDGEEDGDHIRCHKFSRNCFNCMIDFLTSDPLDTYGGYLKQ